MTKTDSLFYAGDDTPITSTDENGYPAESLRMGKDKDGNDVLLRFRHGYLDGESSDRNDTPPSPNPQQNALPNQKVFFIL